MSAFGKELLRTITRKPGRFLALMAIVALGAGFYAGLRSTAPDMKIAFDQYLDGAHVYDVRVVSTMGLAEDDLDALRALGGVEAVMGSRQADVLALFGDAVNTTRVHSLPDAARASRQEGPLEVESDDDSYLNRLVLTEGRWPEAAGECVISADRVLSRNYSVGDTVEFTRTAGELDDTFSARSYTIVGKVHMPYYVSSAAIDASSLGSGVVQQVLYVCPESFAQDYPITDAFVTVEGARGQPYGTDAYDALIRTVKDEIESIADERCEARMDSLTDEMYERITTYDGFLDLVEYRLSHTKDEMDNPEKPEWLVMDRGKNAGMASFNSDADRVDHIASIFPFIFFLVAALVALTTMTRMVDEERRLIGTYKALGYSRAKITAKYVIYVLAASVLGSAVGIGVLSKVLPGVIMVAYAIMYYVPVTDLPINWPIAFLSAGMVTVIVLGATWASVATTLRERPAYLMLPRAPKAGKRILLERIAPVWKRLSFSWKVTCRNLFRYKKRLVMTVIGIAGCTALLLTGLGLHDAINDIIDMQYGEIIQYNAVVSLEDDADDAGRAAVEDALAQSHAVVQSTYANTETMLASGPQATEKRIDIVVPEDPEAYARMKVLRTRIGHEPLSIGDGCALLNEKMAEELGVGVGDTVRLSPQDAMGNATTDVYEFTVGALYENYIYNYLYVSQADYAKAVGSAAEMNSIYASIEADSAQRAFLEEALDDTGAVKTFTYNDETVDTYKTMLRSVDLVVAVLALAAAALAFIVLYNLTNINIEERIREIATLKVLGFTRRETYAYIFRETILLALAGAAFGLVLGIYLEGFVVLTAEVDQVMFGRTIHAASFIVAFALTLAFSALSMLLMLPKLSRVDMVESLKSNE